MLLRELLRELYDFPYLIDVEDVSADSVKMAKLATTSMAHFSVSFCQLFLRYQYSVSVLLQVEHLDIILNTQ